MNSMFFYLEWQCSITAIRKQILWPRFEPGKKLPNSSLNDGSYVGLMNEHAHTETHIDYNVVIEPFCSGCIIIYTSTVFIWEWPCIYWLVQLGFKPN